MHLETNVAAMTIITTLVSLIGSHRTPSYELKQTTESSCLMRTLLLRISSLRFFKTIYKFALCEFTPYALGYFISLVRLLGYFCPFRLMRIFSRTKSRIRQEPSVSCIWSPCSPSWPAGNISINSLYLV